MRSGIPSGVCVIEFDENNARFERKQTIETIDAPMSVAADRRTETIHVLLGPGCKNFRFNGLDLVEESCFAHDIRVGTKQDLSCVRVSEQATVLALGGENGTVQTLSLPDCEPLAKTSLHGKSVNDMDITSDGSLIVSLSAQDQTAFLWNPRSGTVLQALQPVQAKPVRTHLRTARFCPLRHHVLYIVESNPRSGAWVSVWRQSTSQPVAMPCQSSGYDALSPCEPSSQYSPIACAMAMSDAATCMAVDGDGKIAISSSEGHVTLLVWRGGTRISKIWSTDTRVQWFRPPLPPHALPVTAINFSGRGRYFLTASADFTLAAWPAGRRGALRYLTKIMIRCLVVVALLLAVICAEDRELPAFASNHRTRFEPHISSIRYIARPRVIYYSSVATNYFERPRMSAEAAVHDVTAKLSPYIRECERRAKPMLQALSEAVDRLAPVARSAQVSWQSAQQRLRFILSAYRTAITSLTPTSSSRNGTSLATQAQTAEQEFASRPTQEQTDAGGCDRRIYAGCADDVPSSDQPESLQAKDIGSTESSTEAISDLMSEPRLAEAKDARDELARVVEEDSTFQKELLSSEGSQKDYSDPKIDEMNTHPSDHDMESTSTALSLKTATTCEKEPGMENAISDEFHFPFRHSGHEHLRQPGDMENMPHQDGATRSEVPHQIQSSAKVLSYDQTPQEKYMRRNLDATLGSPSASSAETIDDIVTAAGTGEGEKPYRDTLASSIRSAPPQCSCKSSRGASLGVQLIEIGSTTAPTKAGDSFGCGDPWSSRSHADELIHQTNGSPEKGSICMPLDILVADSSVCFENEMIYYNESDQGRVLPDNRPNHSKDDGHSKHLDESSGLVEVQPDAFRDTSVNGQNSDQQEGYFASSELICKHRAGQALGSIFARNAGSANPNAEKHFTASGADQRGKCPTFLAVLPRVKRKCFFDNQEVRKAQYLQVMTGKSSGRGSATSEHVVESNGSLQLHEANSSPAAEFVSDQKYLSDENHDQVTPPVDDQPTVVKPVVAKFPVCTVPNLFAANDFESMDRGAASNDTADAFSDYQQPRGDKSQETPFKTPLPRRYVELD